VASVPPIQPVTLNAVPVVNSKFSDSQDAAVSVPVSPAPTQLDAQDDATAFCHSSTAVIVLDSQDSQVVDCGALRQHPVPSAASTPTVVIVSDSQVAGDECPTVVIASDSQVAGNDCGAYVVGMSSTAVSQPPHQHGGFLASNATQPAAVSASSEVLVPDSQPGSVFIPNSVTAVSSAAGLRPSTSSLLGDGSRKRRRAEQVVTIFSQEGLDWPVGAPSTISDPQGSNPGRPRKRRRAEDALDEEAVTPHLVPVPPELMEFDVPSSNAGILATLLLLKQADCHVLKEANCQIPRSS
jgi:hypothetical protein